MRHYVIALLCFSLFVIGTQLARWPAEDSIGCTEVWPDSCVPGPILNTATDLTELDDCKGAWYIGLGATEHLLDRCDADPAQSGDDSLVAQGPPACHGVAAAPTGTSPTINARYGDGTHPNCADMGVVTPEPDFTSPDFTIACWLNPDDITGARGFMLRTQQAVDVGVYSLKQVSGLSAQLWGFLEGASASPSDGVIDIEQDAWQFFAMAYNGTAALDEDKLMVVYASASEASNQLQACTKAGGAPTNHTCNTWVDPITHDALIGALFLFTVSGSVFPGSLFECSYFGTNLSETQLCSYCRCGIEGENSGITADRGIAPNDLCNTCALLGGATTCGDL